jgi:phosphatidylethanolamine-binding protein
MMMDLDMVPPNGTMLNSSTTYFLNWMATDVNLSTDPITIPDDQGAPYFPPSPAVNDPAHRYVFLLFAQPSDFVFPSSFQGISPPILKNARLGFDLVSFAIAAGLNLPIAADWMTIKNVGNSTMTSSPSAPSAPSSAPTGTAGNSSSNAPTGASPPKPKKNSATGILNVSTGLTQLGLLAGALAVFV